MPGIPNLKEERYFLSHSVQRFQSMVDWLQGRPAQQRKGEESCSEHNGGDRESMKWGAERERPFQPCPGTTSLTRLSFSTSDLGIKSSVD